MDRPHTLLCVPNWIGDGILAMPALQRLRELQPNEDVVVLAKPAVAPLWAMHAAVHDIRLLAPGVHGLREAGTSLRRENFARAFVLPNSVRAALVPWLARIPERIGFARSQAAFLFTERVRLPPRPERAHQSFEYLELLAEGEDPMPARRPRIELPETECFEAEHWLPDTGRRWIGLMPGAARGPSKRWPAQHFRALASRLVHEKDLGVVLMGSAAEAPLCEEAGRDLRTGVLNLAGRTPLPLWAALLARCAVAVCNDSGGMHLASAVGTPVVAIYGHTDPNVTGPIGEARILQRSAPRGRDIARDSEAARNSLASIAPEDVYDAVRSLLSA